ncbi:transcription factor bHLH35-like [Curcuma longa]|uniref:transcription factor bHLH35-like n=1 Tax=Curcuma longa TaxID=136217 RepID=UPI003D9F810D
MEPPIQWTNKTDDSFEQAQELFSYGSDPETTTAPNCCNSSSRTASMALRDNIILQERERRKRFNQTLYDLRGVVPNITKMSKTSIIHDAINYIQQLQDQERSLLDEISDTEKYYSTCLEGKRDNTSWSCSMEVMEIGVREMGNGTSIISITSENKKSAITRVCQIVESCGLSIIAANITSRFGIIFHTIVAEDGGIESSQLKRKIEAAFLHRGAPRNTFPVSWS